MHITAHAYIVRLASFQLSLVVYVCACARLLKLLTLFCCVVVFLPLLCFRSLSLSVYGFPLFFPSLSSACRCSLLCSFFFVLGFSIPLEPRKEAHTFFVLSSLLFFVFPFDVSVRLLLRKYA